MGSVILAMSWWVRADLVLWKPENFEKKALILLIAGCGWNYGLHKKFEVECRQCN